MSRKTLPGGPTQDEILAVSLSKLGVRTGDIVLDCGCGTGKVAIAMAAFADNTIAVDKRPEAVRFARREAKAAGVSNIEFHSDDIETFLANDDRIFDCAFVGGTKGLASFLPVLAKRVRRTIVINAVLLSTLHTAVSVMQDLGIFREAVHIQAARSSEIAGKNIMFKPIDPVYIIIGSGAAC